MMGWYGHGMGAWAWTFAGLFWVVMIGLIVLGTVAVLTARSHVGNSRDESATEILDRRFARGDIDEESYRAHRAALMSSRHHVDPLMSHVRVNQTLGPDRIAVRTFGLRLMRLDGTAGTRW